MRGLPLAVLRRRGRRVDQELAVAAALNSGGAKQGHARRLGGQRSLRVPKLVSGEKKGSGARPKPEEIRHKS